MRDYSCHTVSSIINAFEKSVNGLKVVSVFVKRSGNIMFKYPPTVAEINQTTTLNQPFQIEFIVLPAKSDSENNLQDMIKTASSCVR